MFAAALDSFLANLCGVLSFTRYRCGSVRHFVNKKRMLVSQSVSQSVAFDWRFQVKLDICPRARHAGKRHASFPPRSGWTPVGAVTMDRTDEPPTLADMTSKELNRHGMGALQYAPCHLRHTCDKPHWVLACFGGSRLWWVEALSSLRALPLQVCARTVVPLCVWLSAFASLRLALCVWLSRSRVFPCLRSAAPPALH